MADRDKCSFCNGKTVGGMMMRDGRMQISCCKRHGPHAELLWQTYQVLRATRAVPYRPFYDDPPAPKSKRGRQ